MEWKFWQKKPTGVEVVERVLAEFVTQEQLDNLSAVYRYDDMDAKEEILDSVQNMRAKYSMEKTLAIAKEDLKYLDLNKPCRFTRQNLRHLFTRKLLKG